MEKFDSLRKLVGPAAKHWQNSDFEEAGENLRQYVAVALRIFERLEFEESEKDHRQALTDSGVEGTINGKGRKNQQKQRL